MRTNKKGMFQDMSALAVGVASLAFILVITFLIMAKTETQVEATTGDDCSNVNLSGYACNATNQLRTDVSSLVGWVGLVIIVAIGILILALVKKIKG